MVMQENEAIEAIEQREQNTELSVYSRMPITPVRGEGCWLIDENGERWLDMYGGHAVALTGHSHPHVVEAIARQARDALLLERCASAGAGESELLLKHAPTPRPKVFSFDRLRGERVAMKLAAR